MVELEEVKAQTADIEAKIKEVEDDIMNKINEYNKHIKEYEKSYNTLTTAKSEAYYHLKKIKNLQNLYKSVEPTEKDKVDLYKLEHELTDREIRVEEAQFDAFKVQHECIQKLQVLYNTHTQYLSQIITAGKQRIEELQKKKDN